MARAAPAWSEYLGLVAAIDKRQRHQPRPPYISRSNLGGHPRTTPLLLS
jgi:hypothetical protein